MIQTDTPPVRQASPFQVSDPGSPGAGMVKVFHAGRPVAASRAWTKPRIPSSPPETPTMTFPFATSGARVM